MKDPLDFMNFSHPIRVGPSTTSSPRCTTSRRSRDMNSYSARSRGLTPTSARSLRTTNGYQSSTTRMQPTLDKYKELSISLHDFSKRCFIDETDPELLNQFGRVENTFTDFNRHARTVFNNLRPTKDIFIIHPTAALIKTGAKLINEWKVFLDVFNDIAYGGVSPQFELMSKRYKLLSQNMFNLSLKFAEPQPTVAISGVRKVKAYIDYIRKTADQQSRAALTFNSEKFNEEAFAQRLVDLNSWVENLFRNIIPKPNMNINGLVGTQREMLIATAELQALFDGIRNFTVYAGEVKSYISEMEVEFDRLFGSLNMPISIGGGENGHQNSETGSIQAKNVEKVEQMRGTIVQINQIISSQQEQQQNQEQPIQEQNQEQQAEEQNQEQQGEEQNQEQQAEEQNQEQQAEEQNQEQQAEEQNQEQQAEEHQNDTSQQNVEAEQQKGQEGEPTAADEGEIETQPTE